VRLGVGQLRLELLDELAHFAGGRRVLQRVEEALLVSRKCLGSVLQRVE
jgi:hypothetical protein